MTTADEAAAQLPRVKQLAEEHTSALSATYRLLDSGALIGPGAVSLFDALVAKHRTVRNSFEEAFDQVRRVAAKAEPPPKVPPPHLTAPPQSRPQSSFNLRSGDPDKLNLLATEITRVGRSWEEAGTHLSIILGRLGLSRSPAQTIGRTGQSLTPLKADLQRRRDELLKENRQQQALQNINNLVGAIGEGIHPDEGLIDRVGHGTDVFVRNFLPGLGAGIKDITLTYALASNPTFAPAYFVIDRDGWIERGPIGQFKGLAGLRHPIQFAKDAIFWDEWKQDPVRTSGKVLPYIILSVVTGRIAAPGVLNKFRSLRPSRQDPAPPRHGHLGEAAQGPTGTKPLTGANPGDSPGAPPAAHPPPDVKVAGPKGDAKVAGRGANSGQKPSKFQNPEYSSQELNNILEAAGGLRGVYERHGAGLAGTIIGEEAKGLPKGSQKSHIIERVGELGLSQAESADAAMTAAQRAWGQAGQIELPNGDIAVVPGHPSVPDTFVISRDGRITVRKSKRVWNEETKRLDVIFID